MGSNANKTARTESTAEGMGRGTDRTAGGGGVAPTFLMRRALLICGMWLACSGARSSEGERSQVAQQGLRPEEVSMTEGRPVCRTESEVVGALGQIASVIGTYELKPFTNQKGVFFREWPVVVLAGGGRPVLIESLWDEDKQPSPEVLNRYRGKRVEVVGRLHAQPPGRIANLAVPCVSPVEQLLILE